MRMTDRRVRGRRHLLIPFLRRAFLGCGAPVNRGMRRVYHSLDRIVKPTGLFHRPFEPRLLPRIRVFGLAV